MLLRLWLYVPTARALATTYKEVYGGVEQGEPRGGVPCQEGWWRTVYQFQQKRSGIHAKQGLTW